MEAARRFPNFDRLSIVVSTMMIAYAVSLFIQQPAAENLSIGGLLIPFDFSMNTVITLAVAAMTASGTDWILRDHPGLGERSTIPHLFLPALSSWVISVSLGNLADNITRWAVLIIGGIFLLVVIFAEFIVLSPEDLGAPVAASLLTAISYALMLLLTVALESTDQRLIVSLPAIALGSGVLSMRVLQLQGEIRWPILGSAGSLLVTTQIAAALHYLPLNPLASGIILLGVLYSAINFQIKIQQKLSLRRTVLESGIPLLLSLIFALIIN